jgi:hypothetical protein
MGIPPSIWRWVDFEKTTAHSNWGSSVDYWQNLGIDKSRASLPLG